MSARPILIDCDPGQDDFINLLLAFAAPEAIQVRGITTVGGNVPLAHTHRNARLACDLAGVTDVPVFAGCEQPLMRPLETAEYLHGESGIEGYEITEPRCALALGHGVDFICDQIDARSDDALTLVATGPLTNIAMALKKNPGIAGRIAEIVIMGGAMREGGNVTPSAEFNMAVDPHAADIVLRSGVPIALFGLDVTHQFVMTRARRERIRRLGSRVAEAVASMLDFSVRYDEHKYGTDGAPLHDPCTMLYLLRPDLFAMKACAVVVETESALTRGHTAVDFWGTTGAPANVRWAHGIDHDGAFDELMRRTARL